MLNYILATIVSFFGLLVGSLLIFMASEEQKPGKKYFIFIQNLTIALISALLLLFYNLDAALIIVMSLIVYFLLSYIKKITKSYFIYPLIGIVFYLILTHQNLLIILSLLTFIYGLVTAFLLVEIRNKKSVFKIVVYHLSFFVTALLPFLISYF